MALNHPASLMPMLLSAIVVKVFKQKTSNSKCSPALLWRCSPTQKCLINDQIYLIFKMSVLPPKQVTLWV